MWFGIIWFMITARSLCDGEQTQDARFLSIISSSIVSPEIGNYIINSVEYQNNITDEEFSKINECDFVCSTPVVPRAKFTFHQCYNHINDQNSALCLNRADVEKSIFNKSLTSQINLVSNQQDTYRHFDFINEIFLPECKYLPFDDSDYEEESEYEYVYDDEDYDDEDYDYDWEAETKLLYLLCRESNDVNLQHGQLTCNESRLNEASM